MVHSLDRYKHPAAVRIRTEGQLPGMGSPRALDLKPRRAAPVNSSPAVGHPADAGPCPTQGSRTPPHKAPSIPVNVLPSASSPPQTPQPETLSPTIVLITRTFSRSLLLTIKINLLSLQCHYNRQLELQLNGISSQVRCRFHFMMENYVSFSVSA